MDKCRKQSIGMFYRLCYSSYFVFGSCKSNSTKTKEIHCHRHQPDISSMPRLVHNRSIAQ